jgi:hypothetical protein
MTEEHFSSDLNLEEYFENIRNQVRQIFDAFEIRLQPSWHVFDLMHAADVESSRKVLQAWIDFEGAVFRVERLVTKGKDGAWSGDERERELNELVSARDRIPALIQIAKKAFGIDEVVKEATNQATSSSADAVQEATNAIEIVIPTVDEEVQEAVNQAASDSDETMKETVNSEDRSTGKIYR